MAGPLVNRGTGVTSKPMYVGQQPVNQTQYAENDPRLQVRQSDPGGLLSRMNPQDLMALRMMKGTDMYSTWVNNLKGQGFSDQDIYQLTNEGAGASGQQAMAGDWRQQAQQAGATPQSIFAGSNYSQFFPQTNAMGGTNLNAGLGAKSATPGAAGGVADPTNGIWNVNTQYADANGTGGTPATPAAPGATSGTPGWTPTSSFTPTGQGSSPFGSFMTNSFSGPNTHVGTALNQQMNNPVMRNGGQGSSYNPPSRNFNNSPINSTPPPTNTMHGGGYSFTSPGWGRSVMWRNQG